MGYKRYYVTAIVAIDDKYDFEDLNHFSSFSVLRDTDTDAYNTICDSIQDVECVCAFTQIDKTVPKDYKELAISEIAPLDRHIISLKGYYEKIKKRYFK